MAVSYTHLDVYKRQVPEMEKNPDNMEFGMLGSGTDIEWNTTGVFDNLTPGTEYQFVVRRKVDEKLASAL